MKQFTFYYEETTEPNGLEVIVPIKKHEKKECFNAIEEQLMYVPGVIFTSLKLGAFTPEVIDIAAKVVYRDENIIISESTLLDYPHILLGTGDGLINYNRIDFQALELEPKRGAVGLILNINDVEVTPPREAVVWSAKTRAAVIDSYNKIVETATKLINKELDNTLDYWEWLQKVGSIKSALLTNKAATGSVLQKLSGIIDASAINRIYYRRDGLNKLYTSDVKEMIGDKLLVRIYNFNKRDYKVSREKIKLVNSISGYVTYITNGASDKYRDRYLVEQFHNDGFIVIKTLENWSTERTSNLIGNSSIIKSYDTIVVPEDFMDIYLKEELDGTTFTDDEGITITIDSSRAAKLRKLEQKILFHELRINGDYVFSSTEIAISTIINKYSGQTVLYGAFGSRELINSVLKLLPYGLLKVVTRNSIPYSINATNNIIPVSEYLSNNNYKEVNAILISKDNEKYISGLNNFKPVETFLIESYKEGKLIFNKTLRLAITFKLIKKIIREHNIHFPNANMLLEDETTNLFGKEFVRLYTMAEFFASSHNSVLSTFFTNCVTYEMNKNKVDDNTLKDYLNAIEDVIPEELCSIIDEIKDVHIVDVKLIEKVIEYCKFYQPVNPILTKVTYTSDIEIYNVLHEFILKTTKFPEELGYFD